MKAKNKTKQSDTCCGSHCMCLELVRPNAQEVGIAGSFNDWHPSVTPMIRLNNGKWAKELTLPPGRYEYRFVVDGEWVDDLLRQSLSRIRSARRTRGWWLRRASHLWRRVLQVLHPPRGAKPHHRNHQRALVVLRLNQHHA